MSVLVYYLLETCWKYMDIYTKLYKYIHGTILWKYMEHNYIMELYYGNTGTQCWFELFHCTVAPCFLLRIHLPRGPGNPAELHRIAIRAIRAIRTSAANGQQMGKLLKDILVTMDLMDLDLIDKNYQPSQAYDNFWWWNLTQSSWSFWASHSLIPLQHQLPFTKNTSKKRTPFNVILEPPSCAHTLAQKYLIELLMWNASYVQKTPQ